MDKEKIIYLPDDGFFSRRVLSEAEVETCLRAAWESRQDGEAESVYTEVEILAELGIRD